MVFRALTCPLVFSLLPQLLPMQFLGIICMEEADVDALEKDLQDRPWVFGFKQVGIVEKYQVKYGNPRNLHSPKTVLSNTFVMCFLM